MANEAQHIQLTVPDQDLDQLSFCESKPAKVAEWVEQLPLANLGQTSKKLYLALPEISRLRIHPRDRFAMLEALRPSVENNINGLAQHFFNHSIILQQKELKIASLAQTLQKHIAIGYKQVVKQYSDLENLNKKDNSIILPTAIERSITASGMMLLHCFQLYVPVPQLLWFELHQLYLFADKENLLDTSVQNSENKCRQNITLLDAYLRTVLMGTIKPNQLSQIDLKQAFQALENWAGLCTLNHSSQDTLFVIQLADDKPPIYTTQSKDISKKSNQHLNTRQLADHLQQAIQNPEHSTMNPAVPADVSHRLIEHLITTWSIQPKRSSDRSKSNDHLTICAGLKDSHYLISDNIPFDLFIQQKDIISKKKSLFEPLDIYTDVIVKKDGIWEDSFDARKSTTCADIPYSTSDIENKIRKFVKTQEKENRREESHHDYEVRIINTSPEGFCLELDKAAPQQVRTGEIISIQEKEGLDWSVGIVRWIRQVGGQRSQIGIELLSPTAIPYAAARIVKKGNDSVYTRVLVLPEIKQINQPATLITPQMSFKQGQKLKLNQHGSEQIIFLSKKILTTSSVSQFEFRLLDNATNLSNSETIHSVDSYKGDDNFDSIWDKL